jgi:AcrR family transcriptional regulator
LSTVRLAHDVGIVQSGFYRHFPSVEACVGEALGPISDLVRADVASRRRAWFGTRPDDAEAAILHYEENLAIVTANPVLADIALKRRFEVSPVGKLMRAFAEGLVADMANDLAAARRARGEPVRRKRQELAAHLILGAVFSGIELMLEGKASAREIAEGLARVGEAVAGPATREPPPVTRAASGPTQQKRRRSPPASK